MLLLGLLIVDLIDYLLTVLLNCCSVMIQFVFLPLPKIPAVAPDTRTSIILVVVVAVLTCLHT